MLEVKRTLVKSGPELWAEVSDPEALGNHLAPFGPIRITRTAGDSLVEWEGERAAGRLALEPSGFGTRVVMTLDLADPAAPEPASTPETPRPVPPVLSSPAPARPAVPPPVAPARRGGFLARLLRRGTPPEPAPAPIAARPEPPAPPPPTVPAEPRMSDDEAQAALVAVLDHLGAAHHRPFTRT